MTTPDVVLARPSKRKKKQTRPYQPPPSERKLPVVGIAIGAVALVLAVGLAVALAGSGGDDAVEDDRPAFGPVTVTGTSLPTFAATDGDAAAGAETPTVEGVDPDGGAVSVGGAASGEPTLVAFLAHWCPHCQAELPVLVDLEADGAFEGVRTVAVLTGTDDNAPNFPPAAWLDEEGWTGDVLLDDEAATAAQAFGLQGYPFLVVLDGEGRVVARTSGELPAEEVEALVDAARA